MNQNYLIQYISYQLHTFVRQYTTSYTLLDSFCARPDFFDSPVYESVITHFSSNVYSNGKPVILSVNDAFTYAFVPTPDQLFIIGPTRVSVPVYMKFKMIIDFQDQDFIKTIPTCDIHNLTSLILLTYNLQQRDTLSENELLLFNFINPDAEDNIQKHFSHSVFQNMEYGRIHNPYDQELREFSSIENGDLEQLKRSLDEDYPGEIGTLAKNPLRQTKNLGIVVVTLASRAAMRGGLMPEVAYSLSDSYIQKIEECNDIPTLFHLFHSAEFQYANMIADLKKQKAGDPAPRINLHISKCKDYIYAHLHDRVSVQDIADELHVNANYLSMLFHKCENISLTEYIRKNKIDLAKNLLIYSQYSYIEIASYLGFSSQSHLGKHFKALTGYTMRRYREAYGMKGFVD